MSKHNLIINEKFNYNISYFQNDVDKFINQKS